MAQVSVGSLVVGLALFGAWSGSASGEPSADANPLQIPAVGTCALRILSPTILELTLVNSKDPDPARVSVWDFVSDDQQLQALDEQEFAVSIGAEQLSVEQVGFKRRSVYAPLKVRDLRIASCLYLQLSRPVPDGATVEVRNPSGQLWPASVQFVATADPLRWSPAVHVNQVGYLPSLPKKGMVGYYLGSLGEFSPATAEGFELIDASGNAVFQGPLTQRLDQGFTYSPTPYQQVWEADFSAWTTPGEYRLRVPGLGTSYPFIIDEGVAAAFTRAYALGIFHQRCGMKEDYPFTRFVHDACHTALAQVPDGTFTAVNNELSEMTSDSANYQFAPALENVQSSLYPFQDLASRDVSGGHHDAGDYSKYTINSAGFIHFLTFAVDAFPGVASLDNLGLPESGDGKSDLLQEAKWEADFLAKMQDSDGGFYFLVYPRDREYEDDVLPDHGDPQVVFPKTTAVTAAAVAALAELGSSPLFKQQFPTEAALYLDKAKLGWAFLQHAIAQFGKDGAYQKITHYGNEFGHDDELAWAACALFVATGDPAFEAQLKSWFDPSDPLTRRWSWWRLFEGYGCATRTYAFAARSGRLNQSALDPDYLAKCEAEIRAAADDQVRFARQSAYGTSFPDPNKAYRSAGWFFSSERAFDITVAYQLDPRDGDVEALLSNLNYEAGCNPINMTYITGLGSRRQHEIVHQYAQNDRRILPPSGLPLGNVQSGFQYLNRYRGELEAVSFPADGFTVAPYPYYDRWGDSFNTMTEFVIMDQARSLASLSFWMAQTSIKDQPWQALPGQIAGLPASVPAEEPITASLVAPGLDLSQARVVWEGRDQQPRFGNPITFAAKFPGDQWVEVEAQLPDGRRVFATTNFLATTSLNAQPNSFQSAPSPVTADMVALFHADDNLIDTTGRQADLILAAQATLDNSNLGWMAARAGAAIQFHDLGDTATVSIPSQDLRSHSDTTAIVVEAMIYVDALVAFQRNSASIFALSDSWNASLQFGEDKYDGPYFRGGTQLEVMGQEVAGALTPKQWHHLSLEINQEGYVIRVDGNVVTSAESNDLLNWGNSGWAKLQIGNFSGWVDEIVVRSIRSGSPSNQAPSINLVGPAAGAVFSPPATITLHANAADSDGLVSKVEFFHGAHKLGEAAIDSSLYTFVWDDVPEGDYVITAKATDNQGASTLSAPLSLRVALPPPVVIVPMLSCPSSQPEIALDGFRMHLSGQPMQQYVLESSPNLVDWTVLSTNTLASNGVDLVDFRDSNAPRQFYRIRVVTPSATE